MEFLERSGRKETNKNKLSPALLAVELGIDPALVMPGEGILPDEGEDIETREYFLLRGFMNILQTPLEDWSAKADRNNRATANTIEDITGYSKRFVGSRKCGDEEYTISVTTNGAGNRENAYISQKDHTGTLIKQLKLHFPGSALAFYSSRILMTGEHDNHMETRAHLRSAVLFYGEVRQALSAHQNPGRR